MNEHTTSSENAPLPPHINTFHAQNITDCTFTPSHLVDEDNTESLYDVFHSSFALVEAKTPALLKEAHNIRYNTYCLEREFLKAAGNVVGREEDQYDSHSQQILIQHKKSGLFFATTRIVVPDEKKENPALPVQDACEDKVLEKISMNDSAEISRFCISRLIQKETGESRRTMALALVGLFLGTALLTEKAQKNYWTGLMEPSLFLHLKRSGITFDHVGEEVDYHGVRKPFYSRTKSMSQRLKEANTQLWEIATDKGTLLTTEN